MKIGKYDIITIESGSFYLDGGAMFGIIPKPLWEKNIKPDEKNRIKLATRNLLLVSDNKRILIDTGMGDKWDEKSKDIYNIQGNISESLLTSGFTPDDITDVILTHLHFDHTGGSTVFRNGKLEPYFRNAKYHVKKSNYDWACNPSDRDKGSYVKDNFIPLMQEGVLSFTGEQYDEEIEFLEVNGHTIGQQLVKISDGNNTLLYSADLLPTTSHIPSPYIMGYDIQPLKTLEEKKRILPIAAAEDWLIFFEHDSVSAAAKIIQDDKGFRAGERFVQI